MLQQLRSFALFQRPSQKYSRTHGQNLKLSGTLVFALVFGTALFTQGCRSKSVNDSGEASTTGDTATPAPISEGQLDNSLFTNESDVAKAKEEKVASDRLYERRRIILQAPKRRAGAPIYVAVLPAVLDWEKGRSGIRADDLNVLEANKTFQDITGVIRAYLADQDDFRVISANELNVITDPLSENNDKERKRARIEKDPKGPDLSVLQYPISLMSEEFLYRLHKEYKIPADVIVVPTVFLSLRSPADRGKQGKAAKELHFNTEFRIYSAYQMVDFGLEFSHPVSLIEDSLAKISTEIQKVIMTKVVPYLPDREALDGTVL